MPPHAADSDAPPRLALARAAAAFAQDPGTLDPKPLPPLANPDDPKVPAKELFGRATSGAPLSARAIGSYAKGCVAGATALPVDGDTWQVMRLSRNRNWGHPRLIASSSGSRSACRRSTAGRGSLSATSPSRAAARC